MYSVLIVDDEELARLRVRQLIAATPDFTVAGESADAATAASAITALTPDLVFLDVHLPDLDGFTVADGIRDGSSRVIFLTARPEHAARAFDADAVDYLVKPVTAARFKETLARARRALGGRSLDRLLVSSGRGDVVIDTREIEWLSADGAYVYVHRGGRRHLLRESLTNLIRRLGTKWFAQVHRSAAVNIRHVREVHRGDADDIGLILLDGTRVPVSRRRAAEVLRLLGRRRDEPAQDSAKL